jgi:hypothetical protein
LRPGDRDQDAVHRAAVRDPMSDWLIVTTIILGVIAFVLFHSWRQMRRAEFIRTYKWPPGLLKRFAEHHPGLERKNSALVSRGLRQFFIAHLMSGNRFVSMPSKVADDLWHEFILYTRDYQRFCSRAFGTFLHHTPAVALSEGAKSNEGLRRVWWYCCKYENIDAYNPSRLPLLFALDTKLNIPKGFAYQPNCEALRAGGRTDVHCGADFSSSSVDGSTSGFGDSAGDSSGNGGSDGGGCGGGGCGGGGD